MPPLSRNAVDYRAYVKGISSSVFRVLEVHLSEGADRLDYAVVLLDLGAPNVQAYVQNLNLATLQVLTPDAGIVSLAGAECLITAFVANVERAVHWGKLSVREIDVGPDEKLTFISRLEHTHFGNPLGFQLVWNPAQGAFATLDHEVVFNPEIKHHIVGNKRTGGTNIPGVNYPIFLDPASVFTTAAAQFQGANYFPPNDPAYAGEVSDANWNLIEAVLYVCGRCNGSQQNVINPKLADLKGLLPDDRTILKNHAIRHDLYLSEALSQLLQPYGFRWSVDYESRTVRRIRISQVGKGDLRTLSWQAAGSDLNLTAQNTDRIRLLYDASMAVNQVRALGDFTTIEATWELKPAWDAALDETDMVNLIKSNPNWETNTQYHRVWRDWVLNEGADYPRAWTGHPEGVVNPAIDQYFRDVWGPNHPPVVARRRRFLPMLTRDIDGQPLGDTGGVYVEWWNPNKTGGANWDVLWPSLPFFHCKVLDDECGISFTGTLPPVLIRSAGAEARVRVTATLRSDTRISGFSPRAATSANADVHERRIDVGSRFHARGLHPGSKFFSDVAGGRRLADVADGRDALQAFADDARDAFDQAHCAGTVRIEGLDRSNAKIGDVIGGVVGRNLVFSLNKGSGTLYPQIVGISHFVQQQKLLLHLNSFEQTDAVVAGLIRKSRKLR